MPTVETEMVEVTGEIKSQTPSAVKFFDGKRTVWLPKRLVTQEGESTTYKMPEWLAKEKELI